jgi:tetratricopeptide (TPR) repeat protein
MAAQDAMKTGNEHLEKAEWDDAIACFSLAIDLDKTQQQQQQTQTQDEAYLKRAQARCFQNSKEHGEGYYSDVINDASLAIAQGKEEARIIRAYAYYLEGDYESAKNDCTAIDANNTHYAHAQEVLGGIHYKKKEYSEARKCYGEAIAIQVDSAGMPGLSLFEKYREACKQEKMAGK